MARAKEWKTANPQKVLAATVARQRKIRRATPPWSNLRSIEAIYVTCPSDHHVDHIIPINGKTIDGYRVSGLHVPWNLQYLLSGINIGKSNRMRPEDHALCEALPSPPPAVDGAQYRLPFYKHHAAIAH
jgi:5-methylcytosine-specific restriction endonuclease McrA